ncbi:membrane protein insertase YidC [soil metagenome]
MSQQLGPDQKPTFLDRGTIIALVLVAGVWFAWSKYVEMKYPTPPTVNQPIGADEKPGGKPGDKPLPAAVAGANTTPKGDADAKAAVSNTPEMAAAAKHAEAKEKVETAHWSSELSSWGMGFSAIDLKEFKTRDDKPILVGATPIGLFATKLAGAADPIIFDIKKKSDIEWVGTSNQGAYKVEKTIKFETEGAASGRAMKITTIASGDLAKFPGFAVMISDEVSAPVSTSFLAPSYDHHDWFVRYEDTSKRNVINPAKPEPIEHKTARTAALSSHYFTAAISDHSDLRPDFTAPAPVKDGEIYHAVGTLEYKPSSKSNEFKTEQTAYVGSKDVDSLRAADADFGKVVDYGMFAILADPLLWLMRFLHSIFGNWGFAIVGLTIIVRAIVLYPNYYSFRSMKVMQKIQPQIALVKERYKSDPKRMNEEVMRLMKENKANPIGGCLPMLIQLPVFFALYQVLGQSIELYRQPFIFWIHDLTIKDPYYVLPVLMGISMFFQQKLTPVADPQQAKILKFMPLIFSALMFSLPSGLTLYIFVSTLFGITQQYVFMKEKSDAKSQNNVREAKA